MFARCIAPHCALYVGKGPSAKANDGGLGLILEIAEEEYKVFYKPYGDYQVGETWTSFGRTITETDVVSFAGLSGDFFSLHIDDEYARTTQFGRRIAHGMLILSISTGLLHFEPGIIAAFYGIDHLRFTGPTFIGDTVHVKATITDLQDRRENQGVVTILHEIIKQTGEIVITGNLKLLLNRVNYA